MLSLVRLQHKVQTTKQINTSLRLPACLHDKEVQLLKLTKMHVKDDLKPT